MWADSRLVDCASSGVRSLGTSSVNGLDGDGDVIDQLPEFQKGPRFRLSTLRSVNQRRLVGEVASIASRIFDAATAGSRRTSLSQTRTTVQPSDRRTRATCRSRWRFRSIFATQYGAFQPSASLPFLFDHCRPCQKSPSQKTATQCLVITKSGRPINAGGCKRYRTPAAQRAFRNMISGVVF